MVFWEDQSGRAEATVAQAADANAERMVFVEAVGGSQGRVAERQRTEPGKESQRVPGF